MDVITFELLDEYKFRFENVDQGTQCPECEPVRKRDMETRRLIIPLAFNDSWCFAAQMQQGKLPSVDFADYGISVLELMLGYHAEVLRPSNTPFAEYFERPEFDDINEINILICVRPQAVLFSNQ